MSLNLLISLVGALALATAIFYLLYQSQKKRGNVLSEENTILKNDLKLLELHYERTKQLQGAVDKVERIIARGESLNELRRRDEIHADE